MAKIKSFVFNDFQTNAYLIYDETNQAVIIDGAANSNYEYEQLKSFLEINNLKLKYILNTHGHLDHVCGNYYLKSTFNIPIMMSFEDNYLVENSLNFAKSYGFSIEKPPQADVDLKDKDLINFGNTIIEVITCPGHTPGGVAFYIEKDNILISGDSLFMQSIGRTDLPGGNYEKLIQSISQRIFTLKPQTVVYPGHGPETNIENEIKYNPFFQ